MTTMPVIISTPIVIIALDGLGRRCRLLHNFRFGGWFGFGLRHLNRIPGIGFGYYNFLATR
jgi:hypothetical protein